MKKSFLLVCTTAFSVVALAQGVNRNGGDPKLTEYWAPEPKVVTPGKTAQDAPSDAIVLFDGKNFDNWQSARQSGGDIKWKIDNGAMVVQGGTGNIKTKQGFGDCQLHIEWRIPKNITGSSQARGNSGVFLAGYGNGDAGYELQVLDSYNNATYVNGQAGSIYKQHIPLVNVNRPPGEWNAYDIIWTAPRFNADGSVKTPARVTAMLNGVLVQNNIEIKGETRWIGQPAYIKGGHGALPIKLQDHGDPSEPISFKNIWIRPL